jgi:hypothetical protein
MCKARLRVGADVCIRPAIKGAFFDMRQVIGFVALKGSWNRSEPTGYKVVRVRFKDGRPDGSYENFVTGFWVSGQHRAEVWGRPAALAVMKDGSLLIGDDTGGTIWRVSYTGSKDRASDRGTTTGPMPR